MVDGGSFSALPLPNANTIVGVEVHPVICHAAISNAVDEPYAHMRVREEKGLRPGGFGLLMTRTLVDELIYNEAHNEVVFVKYVDR